MKKSIYFIFGGIFLVLLLNLEKSDGIKCKMCQLDFGGTVDERTKQRINPKAEDSLKDNYCTREAELYDFDCDDKKANKFHYLEKVTTMLHDRHGGSGEAAGFKTLDIIEKLFNVSDKESNDLDRFKFNTCVKYSRRKYNVTHAPKNKRLVYWLGCGFDVLSMQKELKKKHWDHFKFYPKTGECHYVDDAVYKGSHMFACTGDFCNKELLDSTNVTDTCKDVTNIDPEGKTIPPTGSGSSGSGASKGDNSSTTSPTDPSPSDSNRSIPHSMFMFGVLSVSLCIFSFLLDKVSESEKL